MTTEILQVIQSLGIIIAIIFTLYQIWRSRQENLRQRYLEVDKRYVEFLKQSIDFEDPPVGYDSSLLEHFLSLGGTKKELLLYDLLFSTWESAYLLHHKKHSAQWFGWENWIRAFFVGYERCHLAWEIAGRYFDETFVKYVSEEIIIKPNSQALANFPKKSDLAT